MNLKTTNYHMKKQVNTFIMKSCKHLLKPLVVILLALFCMESHAQYVTGSQYNSYSLEELLVPFIIYKQALDQYKSEIDTVVDYISDILSQNIDSQMRELMTRRYNQAIKISEKLNSGGLTNTLRTELSTLTRNVKSDVVAYNNRIAREREEAERMKQEAERRRQKEIQSPLRWSGSGFALKYGYVVTNYHVVEGANNITIKGINGDFSKSYKASVVATDRLNDLAILLIDDSSFNGYGTTPYSVKTSTSEVGEDIFVLGYPLTATMGEEIKYTTGVISSKTGFQGDVSVYQISAPIQPGNSGGPLFDSKGNLIGIVSAKHTGAENVGYAIKVSYLRNLIESYTAKAIIPTSNSISSLPRTAQISTIKKFVFQIECSRNQFTTTSELSYSSSSTISRNGSSPVNSSLIEGVDTEANHKPSSLNPTESSLQTGANYGEESIPVQTVEVKPLFNGGDANKFSAWVNSQLEYPEEARQNGVMGRVVVEFTIDIDGSITNVSLKRKAHPLLDAEALRVIKQSPKWTPGMDKGQKVPVTYTFPVVFSLR